jgi:protein-L-isoaspartate(D-aspartate) O-methyltransferase
MSTELERERMVSEQLMARGIDDVRVLAAMRAIPRHLFVDREQRDEAYSDRPLPIGEGQTISQPYIVALMTQALQVRPGERVLEIGTGSGYQAAVLVHLGADVFSIERLAPLARAARERLLALGFERVRVRIGDGNDGWPDAAPFDALLVAAAVREIPRAPVSQLRIGGRMILPIGDAESQELVELRRTAEGLHEHYLGCCRFVRLVGRHGWQL